MAAIITDQLRILNASNFRAGVASTANNYYVWVGLPNATEVDANWNNNPPAPKDNFDQEDEYWSSILALKRIPSADVRRVVPKNTWKSGEKYDICLLYTSPSPRDLSTSRMPSSA